jgi:hypothetical protein
MSKLRYPHQYLSIDSLKNEKWKDIPGLEDYFMVSNFGRVKRLEYEMEYKNGAIYIKPEKIIKATIIRQKNKFKNDETRFLVNRVVLGGIRYNLTLSRIVYYCFKEKFNLDDKKIDILCKDGDGLNVIPANLVKATLHEKARRMVARGRFESPLKFLDKEFKLKQRAAIVKAKSKQVSQYNLQGKWMRTFSSAAEAERATNIFATSIGHTASGGLISAGGFVWGWGKGKEVDVESMRKERKAKHRLRYGQKVTQYDLQGNRIEHFPSLQDAHAATGAHETAIRMVIKGVYKSAKGYYWKAGHGKQKIDMSGYKWGKQSMAAAQSKKIKQFTLDGKLLRIFPSIKDAAQSIKVSPSCIIDACKGIQRTSGEYKWGYA